MASPKPHLRQGIWYLRRAVPRRYQAIEPRREIWVSLETDSREEADAKIRGVWDQTVAGWEARLAGDSADAERRFGAARELAKIRGFRFLPSHRVAALPLGDLLDRVEAVPRKPSGRLDHVEAGAVLGGADRPEITVSRALDLYYDLTADLAHGKNENQRRIWRNGRNRPIANFIKAVGDLPLGEITPDDALDLREWWWQRIEEDGLTVNAANKDISALAAILKVVNEKKRLGLSLPLSGLSFRGDEKGRRPAFSAEWLRDKLLAPGALKGLNLEARCLLLGMVNTGYRPSEAAGLLPAHVRLDVDVPHISIEAEGRQLKTSTSRRVIPLVGVSLEAFRECPEGFPRYRSGAGASNLINKFLRANGLAETPAHTIYSLRHSFEDRLLDADVDERIRRDLMGHSLNRQRYGEGASLTKLFETVLKVGF